MMYKDIQTKLLKIIPFYSLFLNDHILLLVYLFNSWDVSQMSAQFDFTDNPLF